jgi:hypothetical protein
VTIDGLNVGHTDGQKMDHYLEGFDFLGAHAARDNLSWIRMFL